MEGTVLIPAYMKTAHFPKFAQLTLIIVTVFMQDTDTTTKREIALKCLILNMGESVEDLIKEFLVRQDYC